MNDKGNIEQRTPNAERRIVGSRRRNPAVPLSGRAGFVIGDLMGLAGVERIGGSDYALPSATRRHGRVQLCATNICAATPSRWYSQRALGNRRSPSMFGVRCSMFDVKGGLP